MLINSIYMFTSDKEIILTVVASALLMIFLILIIVFAVVLYQSRLRKYMQEINVMEINFQEEILKVQSEIEERTLQRISEDIHDNIGQILSLAKLSLHTLKIEPEHPAREQLNSINEYVGKAIGDLRMLSKSLNSAQLSNQSLFECVKFELNQIQKTGLYKTNINEFNEEISLDPNVKLVVFRIIQEVMNNIIKHAKATDIFVAIEYSPKSVKVIVNDNGIGFNLDETEMKTFSETGSGLGNIFRRAKLLNAEAKFDSRPGKGTIFQINIPAN